MYKYFVEKGEFHRLTEERCSVIGWTMKGSTTVVGIAGCSATDTRLLAERVADKPVEYIPSVSLRVQPITNLSVTWILDVLEMSREDMVKRIHEKVWDTLREKDIPLEPFWSIYQEETNNVLVFLRPESPETAVRAQFVATLTAIGAALMEALPYIAAIVGSVAAYLSIDEAVTTPEEKAKATQKLSEINRKMKESGVPKEQREKIISKAKEEKKKGVFGVENLPQIIGMMIAGIAIVQVMQALGD